MRPMQLARSKPCETWKIMKPPAETGFTLTLLYALPFFAVKFFFSWLWKLAADK